MCGAIVDASSTRKGRGNRQTTTVQDVCMPSTADLDDGKQPAGWLGEGENPSSSQNKSMGIAALNSSRDSGQLL
jgi:hypothetical protein